MPTPSLTTEDGITLAGRRWLTDAPRASVVLAHGFSAHRHDAHLVATAEHLHRSGFDVITYDARGHGASGGRCTLGDLERHDVASAVELARSRTDRVIAVGASMGAIAVLRHAAGDRALAGVVAVSCPARWRLPRNLLGLSSAALTRTAPGRMLAQRVMRVRLASAWTDASPPVDLVGAITAPVAFVHGDRDRFIRASDAAELYARSGSVRRLTVVAGMGHAFEPTALDAITDAVEWALHPPTTTPGRPDPDRCAPPSPIRTR
jgi:alpha-beta hydrolase superfamily lysophospholipase